MSKHKALSSDVGYCRHRVASIALLAAHNHVTDIWCAIMVRYQRINRKMICRTFPVDRYRTSNVQESTGQYLRSDCGPMLKYYNTEPYCCLNFPFKRLSQFTKRDVIISAGPYSKEEGKGLFIGNANYFMFKFRTN